MPKTPNISAGKPASPKIMDCNCQHAGQDAIHGPGKRVFNPAFSKGTQSGRYRCSVCKNLKFA